MKYLPIATVVVLTVLAATVDGQDQIRGHVFLPPTAGATVLSTHIDAHSRRLVAMGDLLESAAVARRINLESDKVAMENSLLWVETYFERRKLNREYRDAEHTSFIESEAIIADQRHRRIFAGAKYFGNPAGDINFMMNRLMADTEAYRVIFLNAGETR